MGSPESLLDLINVHCLSDVRMLLRRFLYNARSLRINTSSRMAAATFLHRGCMFNCLPDADPSSCSCGRPLIAHWMIVRPTLRPPRGIAELYAMFIATRNLRVAVALGASRTARHRAIAEVRTLRRLPARDNADMNAALEAVLEAANTASRIREEAALSAAGLAATESALVEADEAYHRIYYASERLSAADRRLQHDIPPPHDYFVAPGWAVDGVSAAAAVGDLLSTLSPAAAQWVETGAWLPTSDHGTTLAATTEMGIESHATLQSAALKQGHEEGRARDLAGHKRPREETASVKRDDTVAHAVKNASGMLPATSDSYAIEQNPLLSLGRARWAEGILRLWTRRGVAASLEGAKPRPLQPGEAVTRSGTDPLASLLVHTWRASARVWACRLYSFATPTPQALDLLASLGDIVEVGAGTGYWAAALRARGVDVLAFDIAPMIERRQVAATSSAADAKAMPAGGSKKCSPNEYHGSALAWTTGARHYVPAGLRLLYVFASRVQCCQVTPLALPRAPGLPSFSSTRRLTAAWQRPRSRPTLARVAELLRTSESGQVTLQLQALSWPSWTLVTSTPPFRCLVGAKRVQPSACGEEKRAR